MNEWKDKDKNKNKNKNKNKKWKDMLNFCLEQHKASINKFF